MMRVLPAKYCPPTDICVDGVPGNILTDAEWCLAEIGHIEKLGKFSVTASFAHPDGLWARVKVELCNVTELGLVMDIQRRAGDALLCALVRSYLADSLAGEQKPIKKFWRGQIVPSLHEFGPSTSPGDVPVLILDDDVSHSVLPDADHGESPS